MEYIVRVSYDHVRVSYDQGFRRISEQGHVKDLHDDIISDSLMCTLGLSFQWISNLIGVFHVTKNGT